MSNNLIQQFHNAEFGEVRVIDILGQPWFVGRDITRALGYSNSRKALKDHDDTDDVTNRFPIIDAMGRRQDATLISRSILN